MLSRLTLIILLSSVAVAEDSVPTWVLAGIMAQETRSYYVGDNIVYVDRRVGAAGELSAFQITKIAWQQVKRSGERFSDLAKDQLYAEQIAMRYLLWLYNGPARNSWPHAVQMYNGGPGKLRYKYYANVVSKARKAGYL